MTRFINALLISFVFSSCSVAYWGSGISPQCAESGWTEIEQSSYKCEYKCADSRILVRGFPVEATGLIGPPILPIIPQRILDHQKLLFDIRTEGVDENLRKPPLDIAVHLPSEEKAYTPIKIADILQTYNIIREEGLFHMSFPSCDGPDKPCRSYLYKFDLNSKDIDSFDIIFLSDFMGCSIPSMHYKKTKGNAYRPLVPPGG